MLPRLLAAALALAVLPALAASPTPPAASPEFPALEVTQGNQRIHDLARRGTGAEVKAALAAQPELRDARNSRQAAPLHLAAINPDPSALEVLLAAGADPNVRDQDNATPLHMAAFERQTEHALLLLKAGADPSLVRNDGRTPRAMAEKARADETGGVIALWVLKGCQKGSDCGLMPTTRTAKKLLKP